MIYYSKPLIDACVLLSHYSRVEWILKDTLPCMAIRIEHHKGVCKGLHTCGTNSQLDIIIFHYF